MEWNWQRLCWSMLWQLICSEAVKRCVEECAYCWYWVKVAEEVLINLMLVADMEWSCQWVCWRMCLLLIWSEAGRGCVDECACWWYGVKVAEGVSVKAVLVADMEWSCQSVYWRKSLLLIWSEGGTGWVDECCASCWNGVKLSKVVLKNALVADIDWRWQRVWWWTLCLLLIWSEAVKGCVEEIACCWYRVKVAEGVLVKLMLVADMERSCQRVCWRMCLLLIWSEIGRGCVGLCCGSWYVVKLSKGVLKNVLVADVEWIWQRVCWWMLS